MFQRYDLRRNFPNGDKYSGEATDDNIKDGRGTYFWSATGATYTGMWKKDQMHGTGELSVPGPDGYKYSGPFVKGQRHGRATCLFNNGCVYCGDWTNGTMHGAGEVTRPAPAAKLPDPEEHDDFVSYVGTFRDNLREGPSCRMIYSNGSEYTGSFESNKRHGIGKIQFAALSNNKGNIASYEGEFVQGHASGVGCLWWRSGDCYEGQVVDYVPNGDGSVNRGSRLVMKGRFAGGKLHGRGSSWSDEHVTYSGEFSHGQWHGEGHYICADLATACESSRGSKQFVLEFRGQFLNGQFNTSTKTEGSGGDALAHYAGGETFHGSFLDDKRHGRGRQENSPIAVPGAATFRLKYTGDFVEDARDGQGVGWFALQEDAASSPTAQETSTGLICYGRCGTYSGMWRQGLPCGRGTWEWDNGSKYDGPVVDFYPDCDSSGTFTHRQWVYVGGFHRGQRHGKGRIQFCNGDVYDGTWKQNVFDGSGAFYTAVSGDTYTGDWGGGKKNGRGTEVIYGVSHYDGEFRDGLRHGHGVLKQSQHPDSKYVGSFAFGEYSGQGSLSLSDGSTFAGAFEGGLCHGRVDASFPNGNKYSGEFRRGEMNGQGEMKYANGDRYLGQLAPPKGQRHGAGIFFFTDGSRLECTWSRNVLHGDGVHTDRFGTKTQRSYFEGSLVVPPGQKGMEANEADKSDFLERSPGGEGRDGAANRNVQEASAAHLDESSLQSSLVPNEVKKENRDEDLLKQPPPTPLRKVVALSLGAIASPIKAGEVSRTAQGGGATAAGQVSSSPPQRRTSSTVSADRVQREIEICAAVASVQSLTQTIQEITAKIAGEESDGARESDDRNETSDDDVQRLVKRVALLRATRLRETRRLLSLQEL